jgi:alkanesulfonate monooxygenase SsuD/methylene tetrahydromethanopterin reductase-like flavin-dependent oxidoreductase (luciferase family)
MSAWAIHFDMRAPSFGPPAPELYRAALEMSSWADERGVASILISEHHGEDDGYLPSPLVMAGAVAAVTRNTFISVNALVLTLRDPVSAAEDCLVVDNLSGGRLMLNLVAGYVPSEFEMFGVDHSKRAAVFEAKVQAFTTALTGEPFEWDGRTIRVTPSPVQRPRPMVNLGGASKAGARRAARLGDGFIVPVEADDLLDEYVAECERLGKTPGLVLGPRGPIFGHVAEDVDAAWEAIGPHVLHELHAYGRMAAASGEVNHPYLGLDDTAAVRDSGVVAVLTPDECLERAQSGWTPLFKPLVGGLAPELGWASLELFAEKVLPRL